MSLRGLRFKHLEVLQRLGEHGTIRATATKLHLSQPAVSKIVSEIEKHCGGALFERSRRGMEPNEAGVALIRRANLLINELDNAAEELASIQVGASALIKIGTLPLTGILTVLHAVTTLRKELPRIRVQLIEGTVPELLGQLHDGRIDCFVGGLSPALTKSHMAGDLVIEPLCDDELKVVVSPRNPIAKRKKLTWRDLSGHRWALPPTDGLLRQALIAAHIRQGLAPPRADIECQSSITVRLLCQLDPGILGVLRSEAAHHENALGLLRTVVVTPPAMLPPLSVITRRRVAEDNPAVKSFVHALRAQAGNGRPARMRAPD